MTVKEMVKDCVVVTAFIACSNAESKQIASVMPAIFHELTTMSTQRLNGLTAGVESACPADYYMCWPLRSAVRSKFSWDVQRLHVPQAPWRSIL